MLVGLITEIIVLMILDPYQCNQCDKGFSQHSSLIWNGLDTLVKNLSHVTGENFYILM